jgi:kynureninase
MQAFVTSSPSIVAMAALEGALEIWDRVTIDQVRTKSLAMTDLFIALAAERQPGVFEVVTPSEHSRRGSQVALRHDEAYAIIQALIERNVIGDFRDPDICRFGFTPLYLRFVDVFDAVEHLVDVMNSNAYRDPRFAVRKSVT